MTTYQIALGGMLGEDAGTDYGTFEAEAPELALIAALNDADRTRAYEAPVFLSRNPQYGWAGAQARADGSGNGAQARDGWWYVTDATGDLAGIYTVAAVDHRAQVEYR